MLGCERPGDPGKAHLASPWAGLNLAGGLACAGLVIVGSGPSPMQVVWLTLDTLSEARRNDTLGGKF